MNKQAVLNRLQRRVEYIVKQAQLNQRPLEYLQHKAEILNYLREAIARVHTGEYGFCIDCARFIGVKRLKAVPGAIRCVSCQKDHEIAKARRR